MNTRMPRAGEVWKTSWLTDAVIVAVDEESGCLWAKINGENPPVTFMRTNWEHWYPPVDRSNDREQYYNVYVRTDSSWNKFELMPQISEEDADTNAMLDQRVALVRFAITDGKFTAEVVK